MTVHPVQLVVTALAGGTLAAATVARTRNPRRRLVEIVGCAAGAAAALLFGYSCPFLGFIMADAIAGRVPVRARDFVLLAVIAPLLYLPFAFGSRADWLIAFLAAGEGVALLLVGSSDGGPVPSDGAPPPNASKVGEH